MPTSQECFSVLGQMVYSLLEESRTRAPSNTQPGVLRREWGVDTCDEMPLFAFDIVS